MFNIALTTFSLLLILELLIWLPIKMPRRLLAAATACEIAIFGAFFIYSFANWYTVPVLTIASYRVFNLLRLVAERRHADHMYQVTKRASLWLVLAQAITIYLSVTNPAISSNLILIMTTIIFAVSLILVCATQRNLRKTRPVAYERYKDQSDWPTVSVLIPARNETDDLAECLKTLIHSTYPKLEIIVLDDCSQNHRTPEIIKGFAHDGVRFISGKAAPASWLAKNHAYQQLADASSGDLLLFCGVDTRFNSGTIEEMVMQLVVKKKSMISFLPANLVPKASDFTSILVQPSRYAWELALPRRSLRRPPVLSMVWLINRKTLKSAGSFAAVSRSIIPERYFAGYAADLNDGYSFLQSDTLTGVLSAKSFADQRATAIRTRYPLLHQSLELTIITSLLELTVLVVPFGLYVSALLNQSWLIFALADITVILLIVMYAQIMNVTYRRFMWRSLWLLPFAALYDVALLHYSMYKYEFSEVEWKGRNVCIPVMQVVSRLPRI